MTEEKKTAPGGPSDEMVIELDAEEEIVHAEFTDSYPLKVLFDILKMVHIKTVQLEFGPAGITIVARKEAPTPESPPPQVYEAIIPKARLVSYVFHQALTPLVHTFPLDEIGTPMWALRKKTPLLFSIQAGDINTLWVDPDPHNPHSSKRKPFSVQEARDLVPLDYPISPDEPRLKLPLDSFSDKVRPPTGGSRSAKNIIECYERHLQLLLAGQGSILGTPAAEAEDKKEAKKEEPSQKIEISREVPKALVKLASMAPHSVIQCYWDAAGAPLKFSCMLGFLGEMNMFFANVTK